VCEMVALTKTPIVARELRNGSSLATGVPKDGGHSVRVEKFVCEPVHVFIRAGLYSTCGSDLSSSIKLAAV